MLLALTLLAALHAAPDSVTGRWQIKGDVVGNPLETVCDINQSGTTITGVCSVGADNHAEPITGEVKGDSVTFQHAGDYQGTALTIIYAGKLAANKLAGTITVKPCEASGSFTAEPAPNAPSPTAPAAPAAPADTAAPAKP
jgi:hypothetical protein